MIELEVLDKLSKDIKKGSLTLGKDEIRFLVDYYYQAQSDRIIMQNRIRAINQSDKDEPHETINFINKQVSTIEEIAKKIEKEEHRHLIKEKDGTLREETDEEFKNRLMQKYLDTDEQMHEYNEWQEDYAEMQAEWYTDNM